MFQINIEWKQFQIATPLYKLLIIPYHGHLHTYIKAIFDIEGLSSMDITPTPKSWESILLFVSSQWILMNFDRTQYFLNERPDKSLSGKHAMIFFITSITLYHAKQKSSHDKLSSHSNHYASQTKIIKPQPKQKSLVIHS